MQGEGELQVVTPFGLLAAMGDDDAAAVKPRTTTNAKTPSDIERRLTASSSRKMKN
jgi:hypothetical protein